MIIERLQSYKTDKAKIAVLDAQIAKAYQAMYELKRESKNDVVEGEALSIPCGEPVQSNNISDPTFSMAFSSNYGYIESIKEDIKKLQKDKGGLVCRIVGNDAALSVINEPQLFVIEEYYMSDCSWEQVVAHWYSRKGEDRTERWAQYHRDAAITKMEAVLLIA